MIDSLESAEVYYDSQYKDVKKIAHIYDKYLQNVKTVIKKVKERQSSLPSPRSDDGGDTPSSGDSDNMDIEKDNEKELTKKLDSVAKMGQHIYHLPSVPILQQSPVQVPPPPPPPVFGGPFGSPPPMPPVAFDPKLVSPPPSQFPPVDFSSPPPFLPPPQQQTNSFNPFSSPSGNGSETFPNRYPPPLAANNGSGNIPTIGGLHTGKTGPSHSHHNQPRPSGPPSHNAHQNNHHSSYSGNGNAGRRKRSFDQDESQTNYHSHHHHQQQQHHSPRQNGNSRFNQRSSDQHLVPAQPVMSIPQYGNGFQPSTRPISTIVGVRRTNSGGSVNSSVDPRSSNGTHRGSRGSRGHY